MLNIITIIDMVTRLSHAISNGEYSGPDPIISDQYTLDMITDICTLEENIIIIEIILIIIIKEEDTKNKYVNKY